jgi:alpha-D-ribose 1-methylphosphonate 5-triphosphate synthase subunit PhnI
MGYVAFRGGAAAIAAAAQSLDLLRAGDGAGAPLAIDQIRDQLRLLVDRVCGEGGLYDPRLAALAVKQAQGDPLEAAFLLRAHRSNLPRLGATQPHRGAGMRLLRRISAAFKDLPGGQRLGPTTDYLQRLFRFELLDESAEAFRAALAPWLGAPLAAAVPASFPKAVDLLRAEGLIEAPRPRSGEPVDITRAPLAFPIARSARLAHLARGESGGVLALAYSTMRGYGYLHPTVAELRYGYLPVLLPHPVTGEPVEAGEVPMTECEIVATHAAAEVGTAETSPPALSLGYGACFGHQECKAISIAMLDRSLRSGADRGAVHPAEDAEFVIAHVDGIEAMGFCSHYKLPHYVTFQSELENLRESRRRGAGGGAVG